MRKVSLFIKDILENMEKAAEFLADVPWRDMAGMRDKLIHFYFGLNTERIWLVVNEDIPRIKPSLKKMLSDLESAGL